MRKKRTAAKKRVEPPPPIRFRRLRTIVDGLAFDLTTPDPQVEFGVTILDSGPGKDRVHYEFRFVPPMSREHASNSYITTLDLQSKRQDVQLVVLPSTDDKNLRTINDDHIYLTFPSHAARLTVPDALNVSLVYATLHNIQLQGDVNTPIYALDILGPPHERYKTLEYFPPVPIEGIAIDATTYPQGLPMSFKQGTGHTSSRVAKLIGYYPGKDNFNGWKRAAMRFGHLKEFTAVMVYLNHFPERVFYQTGFHQSENGSAQPDGLIDDPLNVMGAGEGYDDLDPTQGIIEIKCSRSNCNYEGSYIVQCVWEMMASNRSWCDLVRYCEKPVKVDDMWTTQATFRVARLYRHKETEDRLVTLIKKSSVPFVDSEEYAAMRTHFDYMANMANTQQSQEIPVPQEVLNSIRNYREEYLAKHRRDVDIIDPTLERIEKRQAIIFEGIQGDRSNPAFQQEVIQQIQDYADLLKGQ